MGRSCALCSSDHASSLVRLASMLKVLCPDFLIFLQALLMKCASLNLTFTFQSASASKSWPYLDL